MSGSIRCLKYHPFSGDFLAVTSDANLIILDASTGKAIQTIQVSKDQKNVQSIDWIYERSERLNVDHIAAATDQEAVIFDFSRQRLSKLFEISGEKINCCIMPSPDTFIFGGYQRLQIWKLLGSPKLVESVPGHGNIISGLSRFKNQIASCGHDQKILVWKLNK
jgi:WD40 repeat protein